MLSEKVIDAGTAFSAVYILTDRRLILCHLHAVPQPRPSRQRIIELQERGWQNGQIATMYGVSLTQIADALNNTRGRRP